MKILILDNYDSFTWNLAQYFQEIAGQVFVYKNNAKSVKEIEAEKPTHIVISPGPGTPKNSEDIGICLDVIKKFAGKIPILGVCLGHQMIAHVYGARIISAPEIVHGKTSVIIIEARDKKSRLFQGIPQKFPAMRYHSLIVDEKAFPKDLRITARTQEVYGTDDAYKKNDARETNRGLIMALEHKKFPLYGLQFHPESFATPYGKKILKNFLKTTLDLLESARADQF